MLITTLSILGLALAILLGLYVAAYVVTLCCVVGYFVAVHIRQMTRRVRS